MSDIGLIMNALLGLLLVGALAVGWRLERRLKALRASHQSFAQAVEDLDRAAARAEQGLASLRAATDAAAEGLAGRIERAGHLVGRLESLTADAVAAEARLLAAAARPAPTAQADREALLSRFSDRYGAAKPESARAPSAQATARHDLILDDEPEAAPSKPEPAVGRLERLRALAQASRLAASPRAARDEPPLEAPRRAVGGLR